MKEISPFCSKHNHATAQILWSGTQWAQSSGVIKILVKIKFLCCCTKYQHFIMAFWNTLFWLINHRTEQSSIFVYLLKKKKKGTFGKKGNCLKGPYISNFNILSFNFLHFNILYTKNFIWPTRSWLVAVFMPCNYEFCKDINAFYKSESRNYGISVIET